MPVPLKRARVILLSGTVQSIDLLSADSAGVARATAHRPRKRPDPGGDSDTELLVGSGSGSIEGYTKGS